VTQRAIIRSTGMHVPARVVTNHDLQQYMDTSDEWIQQRTGIRQRHWVPETGETGASDLALAASKQALERAGWAPEDVELILFGTLSPDLNFPGSGCLLQAKLGLETVPAMDIHNQCSGFLYGLATADAMIRSGQYRRILLVGAEVHSTGLDISTRGRDVAVIFGDGAGAVCIEADENVGDAGVLANALHAQGAYARELMTELPASSQSPRMTPAGLAAGRHYPHMNGAAVFKHAVRRLPQVTEEVLAQAGVAAAQVDLVIPHQANRRINEFVARALKLDDSQIVHTIEDYGNTTAASIPMALHHAIEAGRVQSGALLLFLAFGAGFTWAASLYRVPEA